MRMLALLVAMSIASGCASTPRKAPEIERAETLYASCRYDEAQATLDDFVGRASPHDAALAKIHLADLAWRRGELNEAESLFREAIGTLDLDEARVVKQSLGKLYLLQGRYAKSVEELEAVQRLDDSLAETHVGMGYDASLAYAAALAELGRWDGALASLDRIVRLYGTQPAAAALREEIARRDTTPGAYRRALFGDDLSISPGNVDLPPTPVELVAPSYPLHATYTRTEGYVVVKFRVRADGAIADPQIVESHPNGFFDVAALDAVKQWKMKPATHDCQPIERVIVQRMDFRLPRNSDSEWRGPGFHQNSSTPSPTNPATIK